ncbi:G10 protein [Xylariaceae sp. FL0255]|nr:G10 protein [Xylariaceae sp. FL0255]
MPVRGKKPPPEFEDIREGYEKLASDMKNALDTPTNNVPKHQAQWPIFEIANRRSRFVYEWYYEKGDEGISKELYDWLLKNGYADPMLIAKWKKQGYEKLCCLRCIQTKETNFQSTCICRVPKAQLKDEQDVRCVNCGCRGCASSD